MAGKLTPERIVKLSKCEVFVFGTDERGTHSRGAARFAHKKFGAVHGVGRGPTGRCYAIPVESNDIEVIKNSVDEFIAYASEHPNNRFLVTRVGVGVNGLSDKDMAPVFKDAMELYNVTLPKEWIMILTEEEFLDSCFGIVKEKAVVEIPAAINENDLISLCNRYKYIISARIVAAAKPDIWIRYVIARGRFGYASFGNFFFTEDGELYVWSREREFAVLHDQAAVEVHYGDECIGRGYYFKAIFAGVLTPYRGSSGESVYTGDVIEIELSDGQVCTYALGTLGDNSDASGARYAFVLDNHCILPEDCKRMTRVGTVFYRLDKEKKPVSIARRCYGFQPWHPDGISEADRLRLARYTPNFDQEIWKYYANETLGIEFV